MLALLTMLSGSKTRSSELARSRVGQRRQSLHSSRPRVEALEDRRLMSVNVMTKFNGIRYDDFAPSNSSITYPTADPSLAAGPKYLVETVNSAIAFIDKSTGKKIYEKSIRDFFASLNPHAFDYLYNPTVTYDELLGRFVVVVVDNPVSVVGSTVYGSNLDVAVSKTSDPGSGSGGWTFTQVDIALGSIAKGGNPKIGWNYDSLVVSLGMSDGTLTHSNKVVAFDSSTLKNTNPGTWKYYVDTRQDPNLFVPATMHGSRHGDPMWFAESQPEPTGTGFDEVAVKMTNVLSSNPSFTSSVIAPNQPAAIPAPHAGSTQTIAVNSYIHNVSWRNNRLVTAWVTGFNNRFSSTGFDEVYWVEENTSSGNPTSVAFGEVSTVAELNAQVYRYDPAIEIDPHMNLGLTLVQSSATQYMSMCVTGITAAHVATNGGNGVAYTDPPVGTHFGQAPRESGGWAILPELYAGMCVDPVTGMFWAGNEFMPGGGKTTHSWGTGIANFSIN
jgi:hypothetical protein